MRNCGHSVFGKCEMDSNQSLPAYVSEASTSLIVVKVFNRCFSHKLHEMGFSIVDKHAASEARILTDGVHKKAAVLSALRDAGVCYSAGPGWSPASVFEELRDNGLVAGPYQRVFWRGSGGYVIEEIQ